MNRNAIDERTRNYTIPPHDLAASYRHCQVLAKRSSSSFYYSFLLLPKRQRLAMCALYAFLRRTDDLGDSFEPVAARRHALDQWRRGLVQAMQGEFADPLLPALADTVRTFDIPLDYLHTAIDGVEMDLDPEVFQTFAELEQYCYRVASVVGLACLRIWGVHDEQAVLPARQCGIAFQMTNILRDLKEDATRGRIYLPHEDITRFGYSAAALLAGIADQPFRELMRFEIARTEQLYAEAEGLAAYLTPEGARMFGSMFAVYRALLAEVKRAEGDVLIRRVRLSRWRKMRIATHWFLARGKSPRAVGAAPS